MNMTIGIADAKARLSEIIDRVETGEVIIIARNGEPVAELRAIRRVASAEAVKRIRAIASRIRKRNASAETSAIDGSNIRAIAHEKHRFS